MTPPPPPQPERHDLPFSHPAWPAFVRHDFPADEGRPAGPTLNTAHPESQGQCLPDHRQEEQDLWTEDIGFLGGGRSALALGYA